MNVDLKLAIVASETTQRELAKALGWPEDVLSKIIQEVRVPKPDEKIAWAGFLGKSIDDLFPKEVSVA